MSNAFRQVGIAARLHRGALAVFTAATIARGIFGAVCFSGETTDALLDECAAGIDANLALINHGNASYHVTWLDTRAWKNLHERRFTVAFDLPLRRVEERYETVVEGQRRAVVDYRLYLGERRIHYRPPLDGSRQANANIVVIKPERRDDPPEMEPREQRRGIWAEPPPFTSEIEYMRRKAPESVTARRDERGLIEITFLPTGKLSDGDAQFLSRGTYWISPGEGYALVRAEEWLADWHGAEPNVTYEAELRQVSGGAFVVSHRRERVKAIENGALTLLRDEEIWLDEIDLLTAPDSKVFTLDGLDLPLGAPIHDELSGREYRYGIDAVDEDGINVGRLFGSMTMRSWLMALNAAVGGAFLFLSGRRLGRWCDGRAAHAISDWAATAMRGFSREVADE